MYEPGFLSNLSGALMFLALGILLLVNWRGHMIGGLLLLASMVSAVWFTLQALQPSSPLATLTTQSLGIVRTGAWLAFLYVVLSQQSLRGGGKELRQLRPLIYGLPGSLLILVLYLSLSGNAGLRLLPGVNLQYIGYIAVTLLGLLLLEKLYRSTSPASRWSLKYMCLGIGGIFIYDLFLYSDALMFNRTEITLLEARGAINAICVPLVAFSVARNPDWKLELFVSRHIVYHSTTVIAAGIYLVVMAIAGYYVRNFGGQWGATLQTVFFFGALLVLLILFFSTDLRARLRIFIAKHFYKNKYDYREEWLSFARTLADNRDNSGIYKTIIRAVAGVIKSPGGALWLRNKDNIYQIEEKIGLHDNIELEIPETEEFVRFMQNTGWIINIDEYNASDDGYENILMPDWITSSRGIWLILPLFNGDSLTGFMALARPHGGTSFDWEDIDLLKTVGYQTAAYIELLITTEALSEARQFETFNRLSAFMVHDIKNIVAQLSLVTSNYSKYKDNPEFIDDAMETIQNAVSRLTGLVAYFGKDQIIGASSPQKIDLLSLLEEIVNSRQMSEPRPVLRKRIPGLTVNADKDKLLTALEHIVQNAQDATDEHGKVWLGMEQECELVRVSISDDGCGMDGEFIKTRLFKPFDTTKGNAGMGIGVYESREIIRNMGGNIKVESSPGKGTVFSIFLPCHHDATISGHDVIENQA